MSTDETPRTADAAGTADAAVPLRHRLSSGHVALAVILIAYLPLVTLHLGGLWRRPHYQFFPLFLAGLGGLLWTRSTGANWQFLWTRRRCVFGGAILVLAVLLLLASVTLFSPWLAAVSALLLGAAALVVADPQTRRDLLPLWLALWLLIPPPVGLDGWLIQSMQRGVARDASQQLDLYGINHLPLGTTLAFPEKQLLVEEACSGIRSLFALVACTVLYALWMRIGILPVTTLLAGAFFSAYLANVLRVLLIVVAYNSWAIDLSIGWPHELLGLVVFTIALGLMGSLAVLVRVLFARIPAPEWQSSRVVRAWNWLVAGRRSERQTGRDEFFVEPTPQQPQPPQSERQPVVPVVPVTPRPIFAWSVAAVFLFLGGLQLVLMPGQRPTIDGRRPPPAEIVSESLLPAEQDGWTLVDYEVQERGERSQSPHSNSWTYRCPTFTAIVSFDYPYEAPHDLSVCYRNIGWRIGDQHVAGDTGRVGSQSRWPYQVVECHKPIEEHGHLLFCAFDVDGQPLDPPLSITTSVRKLFAGRLIRPSRLVPRVQDTYQVQLIVFSDHVLSEGERAAATDQFLRFRDMIRDRWIRGRDA